MLCAGSVCAERTAMAMVKLLQISTAVFVAPRGTFMNLLVLANAGKYRLRYTA